MNKNTEFDLKSSVGDGYIMEAVNIGCPIDGEGSSLSCPSDLQRKEEENADLQRKEEENADLERKEEENADTRKIKWTIV